MNQRYHSVKIDIDEFLARFEEVLSVCYMAYDQVVGFDEAVEAFDDFDLRNRPFVEHFASFRGDPVSSDREAASFMFTLKAMLKEADYEFV